MAAGASGMTEVLGYCRNCGKALTAETIRYVGPAFYCVDCQAAVVQRPPAAEVTPEDRKARGRAATAAALGIIPGLGAVYNGDFVKAVIHIVIFGTIISLINRAPGLFVPMLVAWIFYMPFDAYQSAMAKAKSAAGNAPGTSASGQTPPAVARHEQIGPIILIGIGTLALLDRLNLINLDRVFDFWPLGLIALGVWLLLKRQQE